MSEPSNLLDLVVSGELDADLAALLALLAERGVPLVVASGDGATAAGTRAALSRTVRAGQPARDAVAGGVVLAESLQDVLRLVGGTPGGELTDPARDLGVVVIRDKHRVLAAYYLRPVERDAAGHLQRRPPALLSAWNDERAAFDHFHWSISDELASRAGMTRAAFETEHERRAGQLGGGIDSGVVGSRPWH
jgi:hypothetical protein